MVEFCWKSISKPIKEKYHERLNHHHLTFDEEKGRHEFRESIKTIFRRNGIAYELTDEGRIKRLIPPVFSDALVGAHFDTGDSELDRLLRTAQKKFFGSNPDTRREALEALWDAWERLKTLDQGDKKSGVTAILDATAGSESPKFREALGRRSAGAYEDRESFENTPLRNKPGAIGKKRACRSPVLSPFQSYPLDSSLKITGPNEHAATQKTH